MNPGEKELITEPTKGKEVTRKEYNEIVKTKMQEMRDKIECEQRKQRATMSIDDLIKTTIHKQQDDIARKQREELKTFLDTRAGSDHDGQQFMKLLDESKSKLGPYTLTVAQEFIQQ